MTVRIDVRHHAVALHEQYILLLSSNSHEKKSLNSVLQNCREAAVGADTSGCSIGRLADRFVLHVTGESGISRTKSVGRLATKLLCDASFPSPALVVLAGFAWRNPSRTASDAVILATSACALNSQRETPEGLIYDERWLQSPLTIQEDVIEELRRNLRSGGASLAVGPIATLETRFESNAARDRLLASFPSVLGGEMEGFGVLPSCSVPWVILKAVSDDGGDSFDAANQPIAAGRAAQALRLLIPELSTSSALPKVSCDGAHDLLADILVGLALKVRTHGISSDSLNDYLDREVGRLIAYKLRHFGSELEYGSGFPRTFCDCLLELMQNAIRHGRATEITVQFHPSKIILLDNGDHFDPRTLEGNRGGARAWREAAARYGVDTLLTSSFRKGDGNRYVFALSKASKLLAKASRDCPVRIQERTIGASYGRPQVLNFDPTCTALFFDVAEIRMMSRRLNVLEELRDLVHAGKKLFLACHDEQDVAFWKRELSDVTGELLVIFVRSA